MSNYRTILKRVGIVLITVGIVDTAYTFHRLSQAQNSSSYSFNIIYFLIIGVLLLEGNLRAVPVITWFVAFAVSSLVSTGLIVLPFLRPVELWLIQFRLDSVNFSLSILTGLATIALLFWVYTQLRSAPVVLATLQAGYSVTPPKLAFILGVMLAVLLSVIMYGTLRGEAGAKAIALAQTQYGQGYKYHVTGMRWDGNQVKASLIAYNQQEIKPVQVEWQQ